MEVVAADKVVVPVTVRAPARLRPPPVMKSVPAAPILRIKLFCISRLSVRLKELMVVVARVEVPVTVNWLIVVEARLVSPVTIRLEKVAGPPLATKPKVEVATKVS